MHNTFKRKQKKIIFTHTRNLIKEKIEYKEISIIISTLGYYAKVTLETTLVQHDYILAGVSTLHCYWFL